MSPAKQLTETKACELLSRLFRSRGFQITRNIPFSEYGVSFHVDGWDSKERVGFEFLSSEDDDHDDLTLDEYQTLMAAQLRGELALFVIDEVEPLAASDLRQAAEDFLDEVAAARAARRKRAPKKVKKSVAKTSVKRPRKGAASSTKSPGKKVAAKTPKASGTKAAAKRRARARA